MIEDVLEKIRNNIDEMEYLEDAWKIQDKINELLHKGEISNKQWEVLQSDLLWETKFKDFDLVSIDDYDWELMKECNPNLSEQ